MFITVITFTDQWILSVYRQISSNYTFSCISLFTYINIYYILVLFKLTF